MKNTVEEQKEEFILDMSTCFNRNGAYKVIQDCATAYFDLDLHNYSVIWDKINKAIADTILDYKEENL